MTWNILHSKSLQAAVRITDREQWRMNFRESMKKFS